VKDRLAWPLGVVLAIGWALLVLQQLCTGHGDAFDLTTAARGVLATLGLAEPLPGPSQAIAELRLWRAVCSGLVGASLALAGALLQGLFRNGLAAPSVIGVNAGASLGAAFAILAIGGYLPFLALDPAGSASRYLITGCAFVGAIATAALVLGIASAGGRISVPTLLLAGIAINACIGGVLALIQSLVFENWAVARALMAFTFGSLDDLKAWHAGIAGLGLLLAASVIPFVRQELDLFAAGEDDAHGLGVDVLRTKVLCLVAAAIATACAVAVAGHIAFIGLVVPHMIRLAVGPSHRRLLLLSVLGGAVFLCGTDLLQRTWLGDRQLQPGVLMAMIGGPFFLFLLIGNRRRISGW